MSLVFLIIAIIAVGILVLVAISLTNKHAYSFDVEEYQTKWLKIENSLDRHNPQSFQLAVLNADKLLDKALNEMGTPGKTMGDRLKKVGDQFSRRNAVWGAHILRNKLAHEDNFEIDYDQASRALAAFRQGLKDLGAI